MKNQLGSFPLSEILSSKAELDKTADLNVVIRNASLALEAMEGPTTLCDLCGEADELVDVPMDTGHTISICQLCRDNLEDTNA